MKTVFETKKKIYYYLDSAEIPSTNPSLVHVMKMCQAFQRNGYDTTLYCNRATDVVDIADIFYRYGIAEQFCIETVKIPDWLRKHGHRFGAYYSAWLKTRKKPKDSNVYSRSAISLFFLRKHVAYVYEAHLQPDRINTFIERIVLSHKNCKGLVVISDALKKQYLSMFPFLLEKNIKVLHDAADYVEFETQERAQLMGEENEIKIGYVGSLFPGKCMEVLLPLAQKCPKFRFHVVGGTEYWIEYWRKKAEQMEVHNVFFYGFVENSKLGTYYGAFDICVLPSSKDVYIGKSKRVNIGKWTSPLKLFEAMSYGKPIITSRLETIEEVMCDGEDCIMADPDNIDDWVQKLTMLCENPQLQKKIGAAAKEKLQKEYTWLERARKAAQLFED